MILSLYGSTVLAQDNSKIVSPYVFNKNLVALSNALIYNEQFSLRTASDSLDRFTIQLPKASTLLRFSHVSYTTQYKNIGNTDTIKIQLIPKIKNLSLFNLSLATSLRSIKKSMPIS